MRIEQLIYLINLIETESITKTADRFYMTQQGMSDTLKKMEKEWGVELFRREKRSIVGTEFVKEIGVIAENIVKEYEEILRLVYEEKRKQESAVSGNLSILVHPRIYNVFLPNVLEVFLADNPDINLNFKEKNDIIEIINEISLGNADLGILLITNDYTNENYHMRKNKSLELKLLANIPLGAVFHKSMPVPKKKTFTIKDLRDMPVVVYSEKMAAYYEKVLKIDYKRSRIFYSADSAFHKRLVENKMAVGFCTRNEYDLLFGKDNKEIRFVPYDKEFLRVAVVYDNSKHLSEASRAFIDTLIELCLFIRSHK